MNQLPLTFPTLLTKTLVYDGEEVEIPKSMRVGCYRSRRMRGWTHDEAIGLVARPPTRGWMVGFMVAKARS